MLRALAAALCIAPVAQPAAAQGYTQGYVQVEVGYYHSCALRHDGALWCWGQNLHGELGDGTYARRVLPVQATSSASGFGANNIASIAADLYRTCALNDNGRAFCWGHNAFGQIGDGSTTGRINPVRVEVIGTGVQTLSASHHLSCAVGEFGKAWCWGRNNHGQVGDGSTTNRSLPVPVSIAPALGFRDFNIAAVAAGQNHGCARNLRGRAFCWGSNHFGQLGDGTTTDRLTPVQVDTSAPGFNGFNIAQISAGESHTCALTSTGRAFCWGRNGFGQVGHGLPASVRVELPTAVNTSATGFGVRNIVRIVAGGDSSCALNVNGRAFCWGKNSYGQVGDGTTIDRIAPVQLSALGRELRDIAPGFYHSCAIDAAGDVWCWGRNNHGQLGEGTTADSLVPVRVLGLP